MTEIIIGDPAVRASIDPEVLSQLDAMYTEHMIVPDIDPSLDASFVCYNMRIDAVGYDFPYWLIDAEMTRRRENAPSPLKIFFYLGNDGDAALNMPYRRTMYYNVMLPMLDLVGAVQDPRAEHGRRKKLHSSIDIVRSCQRGEEVAYFRAPFSLKHEFRKPPITITLRECEIGYAEHKNSNMPAWLRFAELLKSQGEDVIFVRDTARASDELPGWPTFPQASLDLHCRMALYEAAKINFFVSNGPVTLCYFSDLPWVAFIMPEPDGSAYEANTPAIWKRKMGVEIGEQFPWSAPYQRIVWERETYENLVETWEQIAPLLKEKEHG